MSQAILSESSQQEFDSRQKSSQQQQQTPNLDPQQFLRSKKRADNYSRKDKERLIELVTGRLDLLENKISNTSVNLQKAQCWVEIANEYNRGIASSDNWRDDRQLKDLWKRMKFTARSDLIRYVRQKEQEKSSRNDEDTNTNNSLSSNGANEILDDFTLILLRLVPAHFQMDTDGKVLQVIDQLLALSPAEVEEQKVLSRNRRQLRRQQMMEHYGNNNNDEDEEEDEDAVVLLEINNRLNSSPDNETVVILDSCLSSNCASNTTTSVVASSQVAQVNERLNSSPQETFYTETIVNPQSVSAAMGNLGHRSQVIDVHPDVDNAQLQHQSQISSQSLLPPMSSASTTQIQQQLPPTSLQQQQHQSLNDEPMFTFKSENDPIINESMRQQNWYIEQIGSRNQFEDNLNDSIPAGLEKDYQYRRKRKTPFYRTLLEDDQSEEMRQQLIEMARKENEKELQLLDVQTQCEKQRLVREKMETENAVLKQRLLLQMLQSHINKDQSLPSISLLL